MIDWQQTDTVLLDMDGTILDLAFDNYFWRELVPRCVARARRQPVPAACEEVYALYAGKQGSLDWYCIDYWTEALALDLRALKSASAHRIRFLPGAREFLTACTGSGRRVVLVTNAHGFTLDVKRGVAGLDRYFKEFVSSHEFGHAKEQAAFWPALQQRLRFDPSRTAFIDDSHAVLDAAAAYGIGSVIGIRRPDTRLPGRDAGSHRAVDHVGELAGLPAVPAD